MKKIILSLIIGVLINSVVFAASTVTTMKSNYLLTTDTVVDAGSAYVQVQAQLAYEQVSIQAVVTKHSGTAAGTVLLSGSIDGTNFINLNTDTLTLANTTTNTKVWVITGNKYMYYRLTALGSGTDTMFLKGYLYPTGAGVIRAASNMKSVWTLNSDTVVNTATEYMTLRVQNYYQYVTLQAVVTKLSGTAGGTVTLQGSNDGTNYVTVSSDYSSAQTLSVSNTTTNSKLFVITGSPYNYYRFKYAGTGTMSCTIRGYLLPSK